MAHQGCKYERRNTQNAMNEDELVLVAAYMPSRQQQQGSFLFQITVQMNELTFSLATTYIRWSEVLIRML